MNDSKNKVVTIAGIGGTGCRVLGNLNRSGISGAVRLLALDTDAESLAATGLPPEQRILAGKLWRNGHGCGGNVEYGQIAFAHERGEIGKKLAGSDLLIITAGLGRGAGTGGLRIIASEASKLGIPQMVLTTLPFAIEGAERRREAERCVNRELAGVVEAKVVLPNDLLFASLPPTASLEEAFELANNELARAVLAFGRMFFSDNLLATDLESFTEMVKGKKTSVTLNA